MGKDLKGKELGKGISQRPDKRYEARYIDRFGNRKSVYATSAVEARKLLAEAQKENIEKQSVRKRYMLRDWYEEWMEVYKEPVIRPNTKQHYEGIFEKHIIPVLGGMYMDEVRQIHVKNLINKLDAKGYQWETQNKVRLLLTDLFNIAMENDYAIKNPARGVRLAKIKPNERVVLTREDQEAFFTCSAGTFYDNLYVAAVNTGLRPGEVCGLKETDIDFSGHTLKVERTLIYQKWEGDDKKEFHLGPPKTETSKREVPLSRAAETALKKQIRLKRLLSEKYKTEGEFADLLFVTKFNTPICSQVLCDSIKRIVDEINLQRDEVEKFPDFSAHTFRHTFATRAIESGMQSKVLQKILGHATLQMTMDLYVHVTEDYKKEEIKRLDDVMPKPKIIRFPEAEAV